MGAAQIITIILMAMNLGINLVMHGKPKDDKYNFFGACLSVAINAGLLWWGGFWN